MNTRSARRGLVAATALVAVLLLFEAVAWACTTTMGGLTISPTTGRPGTVITASATGLKKAPAKYRLVIGVCHGGSVVMKKGIATDINGRFTNVSATVPSNAPMGNQEVCALESEPTKNSTATQHQTFTVLI